MGDRQSSFDASTNSGNGTTTTVATTADGTKTGNTLIAAVIARSITNSCSGITDSAGNTWTRVGAQIVGSVVTVDQFVCLNPTGLAASGTVTATFTGTGNSRDLVVVEFVGTASSVGASATGSSGAGSSSTPAAITVAPTDSTSTMVSVIGGANNGWIDANGLFAMADQRISGGSASQCGVALKQTLSTTADGCAFHLGTSTTTAGITFTLTGLPVTVTGPPSTVRSYRPRMLRFRGARAPEETVPAQVVVTAPVLSPSMVSQPRRLRGMLPRRGHVVTPVGPQLNPTFLPPRLVQPRRARGWRVRRAGLFGTVPPQFNPTFLPPQVAQPRRLRGVRLRRGAVANLVPPQLNPPFLPSWIRQPRRLKSWKAPRGHVIQTPQTQSAAQPPAYPPVTVVQPRRFRGLPTRRGKVGNVVGPQLNPSFLPPQIGEPRRVRGWSVRRGRAAEVVPAQQGQTPLVWPVDNTAARRRRFPRRGKSGIFEVVPPQFNPPTVPSVISARRRFTLRSRPRGTAPPVAADTVQQPRTVRRPRPGPIRRSRNVPPVLSQYDAPATQSRKVRMAAIRRNRNVAPVLPQPVGVQPIVPVPSARRGRLIAVRRGKHVTPPITQATPPPPYPVGYTRVRRAVPVLPRRGRIVTPLPVAAAIVRDLVLTAGRAFVGWRPTKAVTGWTARRAQTGWRIKNITVGWITGRATTGWAIKRKRGR